MKEQFIHINTTGTKRWFSDKDMMILHREDGPAVEQLNGYRTWYRNGKCHREDGPAVEYPSGTKLWYLDGIELTEKEFLTKTKKPDEVIEVNGFKYKLITN